MRTTLPSPRLRACTGLLLLLASATAHAQLVSDFEDFAVPAEGFLNGSELETDAFDAGAILLPNSYDPGSESWSDWSISDQVDTLDASFMNYGAYPGTGAEGTSNYAIASAFGGTTLRLAQPGNVVEGMYVTNATYAALVVRDGNQFSKAFGGPSGDDPDLFTASFRGFSNGQPTADSIVVVLADYRFEDNADDYILDEWEFVDFSSLGAVDSLSVSFRSTDTGDNGINTPAYVCIDQVSVRATTPTRELTDPVPAVYPNPVADVLNVRVDSPSDYAITDARGRTVATGTTAGRVPVAQLAPGLYAVQLLDAAGRPTAAARFLRSAR